MATTTLRDKRSPTMQAPPLTTGERWTRLQHRMAPYLFVSPYFILFAIFGFFPLGYTFWVSLHDWPLLGEHTYVGLHNYRELVSDDYFRNALVNTLGMFVLATVPLPTGVACSVTARASRSARSAKPSWKARNATTAP